MPTINHARLLGLSYHGRGSNPFEGFLGGRWVSSISLALVFSSSGPTGLGGRRATGITFSWAWIIVHTPHVITEIPMAGKAISCSAALAALIGTQVWFVAVSMHGVGFTLMTKEAGRGREPGVLAGNNLASIRFQVRVHEFAGKNHVVSFLIGQGLKERIVLVVALELFRLVLARWLAFPWAVVKPIGLSSHILVQWMIPGSVINFQAGPANEPQGLIGSLGSSSKTTVS
jgi:hypothetical protein